MLMNLTLLLVISGIWLALYAAFITGISGYLARVGVRRKLEAITGGLLILVGVRLAFAGQD